MALSSMEGVEGVGIWAAPALARVMGRKRGYRYRKEMESTGREELDENYNRRAKHFMVELMNT
jgi:hypothetical protein